MVGKWQMQSPGSREQGEAGIREQRNSGPELALTGPWNPSCSLIPDPCPLALQAAAFARAAKAPSSLRAYAADWRHFVA